ncbi:uncharacterized protein [Antennarius striatus]|uniref:uncharacterized protein isoform X2 n=1 Tax=Antennarius striatus TaxID=241820 RepID=UPI0035B3611D
MSRKTIKKEIVSTLENLPQSDFKKFRLFLRDRREGPRIRVQDVEDKSALEIAEVLVKKFTELNAREVTLELLKGIDCNEEAERFESNTKTCVDKGDPTFSKDSAGELNTEPSLEAPSFIERRATLRGFSTMAKNPKEVEEAAKALVCSEGGDPSDEKLVLSRFAIQFGQYKGKTFKWLLENDVSYVAYLIGNHQNEKERMRTMQDNPQMANKESLTQYATAYPEISREVRKWRLSQPEIPDGRQLVGFGKYSSMTRKKLYESKAQDCIRYVDFLRKKTDASSGSKMETLILYILKRDTSPKRGWTTTAPSAKRKKLQGK